MAYLYAVDVASYLLSNCRFENEQGNLYSTKLCNALQLHIVLFVYFLYPLHNIVLCLSILMTVVLAMERFRSISDPIDYHAIIVGGRQWQRVFRYVAPVIVLSVAFNVPKFFELQVDYYPTSEGPNTTLKVR